MNAYSVHALGPTGSSEASNTMAVQQQQQQQQQQRPSWLRRQGRQRQWPLARRRWPRGRAGGRRRCGRSRTARLGRLVQGRPLRRPPRLSKLLTAELQGRPQLPLFSPRRRVRGRLLQMTRSWGR